MRLLTLVGLGAVLFLKSVAAPALADTMPKPAERWLHEQWPAHWIAPPGAPQNEYGIYLFRKRLELPQRPAKFVVHVTADARYRLFVNGTAVGFGPQRSDHWICRYDSIDLAPWLHAGTNVVAAEVWSYGELTPYAIMGERTGLLVQGDTDAEQIANTDKTWVVRRDEAYTPLPVTLPTYIVVGAGDRVNAALHPWGWQNSDFDDHAWSAARMLGRGNPHLRGTDMDHNLAPRNIPAMEESPTRFARVRRTEGLEVPDGFASGTAPLSVPAHTKATVLLDQGCETSAFPELTVSGGKGARVRLSYAEALIDAKGAKGNRDEIEWRHLAGVADEFLPDGGNLRRFRPLNFRTYRYVQLEVETADEPLRVDDLQGEFTAYPFQERGSFASDDPTLARMWTVGWRTARLCAFETYMDCPYYEQLQYVGDTRIQALISLYVAGDDRLMRNAIELYDRSRLAEGLTQSRYPSASPQVINTFSLFWIEMVHDYWMHRSDDAFVRDRLPGIQAVLAWFERKVDTRTGLLGPLPYWTFVDWADEWNWNDALGVGGEPPGARAGGSSIVSLQFAGTLVHAANVFRALGREDLASHYEHEAADLRAAVVRLCWDDARRMFADTPEKKTFSQHANTFAVLAGAIEGDAATDLIRRVVADKSVTQASTYFRFYLLRAMKQVGLGDEYLTQLAPWRKMLEIGLTTFAEKPDPTRSDCHAWSASPVYELLATVCGVEPASPGFATVRIEPHLGALQHAEGVVPHPKGDIRVEFRRAGKTGVAAQITLPVEVTGSLVWNGKSIPLHAGEQHLTID